MLSLYHKIQNLLAKAYESPAADVFCVAANAVMATRQSQIKSPDIPAVALFVVRCRIVWRKTINGLLTGRRK